MKIEWNDLPGAGGLRAGQTRKGICGGLISAVRMTAAPDVQFDGKTHWHEQEQIVVVTEGMMRFAIDGRECSAGPGEMVFFPARSRHAAIGTGPEGAVYYEIFAPARPDLLPGWTGPSPLHFD